ncbi:hypothetical protein ACN38_g3149 [Penicillium nordicum]|uniref:Peptidase M24 domain-containing protein n=1 Tax=Penicillium nordicum TaxID=229535 RepID=A0A0M8P8W1_9EURO|nr:hypothetical protein ACN38_g3149 [Penicillium nordicum]
MGSKTSENENEGGGNAPSSSTKANVTGGEPRGAHWSRDGDGSLGEGDGDDDPDGDNIPRTLTLPLNSQTTPSTNSKKRRKRPKKKSSVLKQSSPPRIPLVDLFPDRRYPHGEAQLYEPVVENTTRTPAEEVRYQSRHHIEDDTFLNDYRKAAEVHRQVRRSTQESVHPGQTLTEIAVGIEDGVRALLDNAGLETGQGLISGLGFPTGCGP